MIWNRFHWLDDVLLPVAVVHMRATWLYALTRALLGLSDATRGTGAVTPDPLSFAELLWLPLAATLIARYVIRDEVEIRVARRVVAIGGVVCIALAIWAQHF